MFTASGGVSESDFQLFYWEVERQSGAGSGWKYSESKFGQVVVEAGWHHTAVDV